LKEVREQFAAMASASTAIPVLEKSLLNTLHLELEGRGIES
jgi:hypothetical protein